MNRGIEHARCVGVDGDGVCGRRPRPGSADADAAETAIADAKPVRSCESLATVSLPNTTIESATVDATNADICRVVAITTHPPAGDKVRIWIAIPTSNWNGRFLGTGGGGFAGGNQAASINRRRWGLPRARPTPVTTAATRRFALDANGRLNWQAIRNFAHVGIHEMTVTGKALTQALYGVAPRYSYFNGCSTGGRQGLMEAQRYPQDYNGIASAAPADQLDESADAVALGIDADERGIESDRVVQARRGDDGGGRGL